MLTVIEIYIFLQRNLIGPLGSAKGPSSVFPGDLIFPVPYNIILKIYLCLSHKTRASKGKGLYVIFVFPACGSEAGT